jgi:hypothetical protein
MKHLNVWKNTNKKCHEALFTVTKEQYSSNMNDKDIWFEILM